jgi:hypothetical protein
MDDAAHDLDPVDRHESNMLVVETSQLRLVRAAMPALIKEDEPDERLDLTLVTLTDATAAADWVRAARRDVPLPEHGSWSGLDRLLAYLRAVFEHDYGWTPILGKNRIMNAIQFVTYPNAGGVDGPVAMSLDELDKADESSQAQPEAGDGVRVGLPDTRLYPHPHLTGRYVVAAPLTSLLDQKPDDKTRRPYIDGHSAFAASLILRESPSARLDIRPVLSNRATGRREGDRSVWEVAQRLVGYLDSGVALINCSWACYTRDGKPPLVLERALAMLTPTILVVAAAGNHGANTAKNQLPHRYAPAFPAALPNVVAVGALDGAEPARFNPTVRGSAGTAPSELAPWIDVLAPGVGVVGAYLGDSPGGEVVDVPVIPSSGHGSGAVELEPKKFEGAARWSGTSFAAATVTGAIAARIRPGTSARAALAELLGDRAGPIRRAPD